MKLNSSSCTQHVASALPSITAASKPVVVVVTGATGVGKTETSLRLAELLDGEIISADSVQVYKHLDVGSDKLPLAQRRGIPHHLIDVLEPSGEFSAGDFYDAARTVTADIIQRGKVPILVGGTGFYLRMYIYGKAKGGKSTPEAVQQADKLLDAAKVACAQALDIPENEIPEEDLWNASVDVLLGLGDPVSATRVRQERNNWYRLRRAVEVVVGTGLPMADHAMPLAADPKDLDYDFRCFFLVRPRLDTFARIDDRVEHMILGGLLDEAKMMLDMGMNPNTTMPTRAIGYRQTMEWLQEVKAVGNALDKDILELAKRIQAASRQLVRSQTTFHRNLDLFQWIDVRSGSETTAACMVAEVAKPEHIGDCGDGGKLTKEELNLIRRWQPSLKTLKKPESMQQVHEWLKQSGFVSSD